MLSARSVKSSRNGVIALPKQLNFISALLSAKVWYGVLELSVILEVYTCIALSYKDVHLMQFVIMLILLLFLTFRSSYILYKRTKFYLRACMLSTARIEGCV